VAQDRHFLPKNDLRTQRTRWVEIKTTHKTHIPSLTLCHVQHVGKPLIRGDNIPLTRLGAIDPFCCSEAATFSFRFNNGLALGMTTWVCWRDVLKNGMQGEAIAKDHWNDTHHHASPCELCLAGPSCQSCLPTTWILCCFWSQSALSYIRIWKSVQNVCVCHICP